MRKHVIGILAVLVVLSMAVTPVLAVSTEVASQELPYEGAFQGFAYGDEGSRAALALNLAHRGSKVTGSMSLGKGLLIDGGVCGQFDLPATVQYIEGETVSGDPGRLVASPSFEVDGYKLEVDFESKALRNGEIIFARAEADLPWFCGRDPSLIAIVYRMAD